MTCRKRRDDVKTGVESLSRDQRGGDPLTARVASGIKVARVRSWLEQGTWEPVASMPREKPKWKPHEGQSTDARHRGGWARSSVEVPVMGMERRGPITQSRRGVNQAIGRNPTGRRGRWPGDKSRMRRESHVRFREGLGVKFPRATRLVILCRTPEEASRALELVRTWVSDNGLTLHPTKTKVVDARTEGFDFLGYHHEGGERRPRVKSLAKFKDTIRAKTRRTHGDSLPQIIASLNRTLRGWFEYFKHSRRWIFPELDGFIRRRLRALLLKRARRRGTGHGLANRHWSNAFFAQHGLFSLERAHAQARQPSRR
jgi:hypothetical protein